MSNILQQHAVLKLNKKGQAIGYEQVEKTFGDLFGWLADARGNLILDKNGYKQRKMLAYDIDFEQKEDGTYLYDASHVSNVRLVDWDEWVNLPVRPFDLFVSTAKKQVRVPRVVQFLFTEKMPDKKFKPTLDAIYDLYDGICAYTRRKLRKSDASRDHWVPRSKGGKETFQNFRLADKDLNSKFGDKTKEELGIPYIPPIIPKDIPMCNYLQNKDNVPEWELFLRKHKKHGK